MNVSLVLITGGAGNVGRVVTRTFLEMRDPGQLKRKELPAGSRARFVRREPCSVERFRELYKRVGEKWHWKDRDAWSDERLARELNNPDLHTWELLVGDEGFRVTLSFNDRQQRLVIPFAAINAFADPSVNFALQFQPAEAAAQNDDAEKHGAGKDAAKPAAKDGNIIPLDTFRKK